MNPKIISIQDIRSVEGAGIITAMVNKRFEEFLITMADVLDYQEDTFLHLAREVLLDKEIPQDED